jgi:DNA polymerase-4
MGRNIRTIGELACCTPELLQCWLGVNGLMLWRFANGDDHAPVAPKDFVAPIKSVGHGTTCVCDLESDYAVWRVLYELAQDVQHRLRRHELCARGVQITVKDNDLSCRQYQTPLPFPTQSPLELAGAGFDLFRQRYAWHKPVRALTIRGISLVSAHQPLQLDLFQDAERRERRRALDNCVDALRSRFGQGAIRAASLMGQNDLAQDKCELVMMPGMMHR